MVSSTVIGMNNLLLFIFNIFISKFSEDEEDKKRGRKFGLFFI